jgi:polyketide synthase Type III
MTVTLEHPADSPVAVALPAISRMVGVGTAATGPSVSQPELLELFGIEDPKVRSVYLNSAIDKRRLTLPEPDATGRRQPEPQGELLAKHKRLAIEMGSQALLSCLERAFASVSDLRHLCCVTSTGFLTPGLSALLIKELGIDPHCSRSDIVGMGCNAGLNALNVVSGWSAAHPGELGVVLCVEACSAAYAIDGTMRTAVVNSLFGDGAAALALISDGPGESRPGPQILKFASFLITDAIDAMRYDWDSDLDRFSFFLDPQIPYVVGANAETVIDRLLTGTGLRRSDIAHWLVHSGGKKVIDAVVVNLGLSRHDVRHTVRVLRDHGNVSSGSFLFSYERLVAEGVTEPGDYGILMTMGPGSTIETALVQW